MMPRLRTLVNSKADMMAPGKTTEAQRHRGTEKREKDTPKFTFSCLESLYLLLSSRCLCASVVNFQVLPGEMGEGLVRIRHLDGVFALGHGLPFLAVGGEELIGETQ